MRNWPTNGIGNLESTGTNTLVGLYKTSPQSFLAFCTITQYNSLMQFISANSGSSNLTLQQENIISKDVKEVVRINHNSPSYYNRLKKDIIRKTFLKSSMRVDSSNIGGGINIFKPSTGFPGEVYLVSVKLKIYQECYTTNHYFKLNGINQFGTQYKNASGNSNITPSYYTFNGNKVSDYAYCFGVLRYGDEYNTYHEDSNIEINALGFSLSEEDYDNEDFVTFEPKTSTPIVQNLMNPDLDAGTLNQQLGLFKKDIEEKITDINEKLRLITTNTVITSTAMIKEVYVAGSSNQGGELGLGPLSPTDKRKHLQKILVTSSGADFTTRRWVKVEGGEDFTLALDTDGELWAWGINTQGQLGIGNFVNQNRPTMITRPAGVSYWKDMCCGSHHALAIDNLTHLWSWGYNKYGQLGLNNRTYSYSSPQYVFFEVYNSYYNKIVDNNINWHKIDASFGHSMGLRGDELYTWGWNAWGQLGNLKNTDSLGSFTLPVGTTTRDGLVPSSIRSTFNINPMLWCGSVTDIAAGDLQSHIIANNEIYSFGYDEYGLLGLGSIMNTGTWYKRAKVDLIVTSGSGGAIGGNFNSALKISKVVIENEIVDKPANIRWKKIKARKFNMVALDTDGGLWEWGTTREDADTYIGKGAVFLAGLGLSIPRKVEKIIENGVTS